MGKLLLLYAIYPKINIITDNYQDLKIDGGIAKGCRNFVEDSVQI